MNQGVLLNLFRGVDRSVERGVKWMLPFCAFLVTSVSPVYGFTLNSSTGSLRGWDTKVLTLDYNFESCPSAISVGTMIQTLDSALSLWNTVSTSSLTLVRGVAVSTTASTALVNPV